MANKITNTQYYSDIADAIRGKLGTEDTFRPSDMAAAIDSIEAGGDISFDDIASKNWPSKVEFSADLISIEPYAFQDVDTVEEFYGENVTTIGAKAFARSAISSNPKLTKFNFPKLKTLGGLQNFMNSPIEEINFPELRTVPQSAFNYCKYIKSAVLSKCTGVYGDGFYQAFDASANVVLNMPELQTINQGFQYSHLYKIVFPKLKSINSGSFRYSDVEIVDIGSGSITGSNSIQKIESVTWANCPNLKTFVIRKEDEVITLQNTNAFLSTPIASGLGAIYVPDGLVASYKTATNWNTLSSVIYPLSEYTGG